MPEHTQPAKDSTQPAAAGGGLQGEPAVAGSAPGFVSTATWQWTGAALSIAARPIDPTADRQRRSFEHVGATVFTDSFAHSVIMKYEEHISPTVVERAIEEEWGTEQAKQVGGQAG